MGKRGPQPTPTEQLRLRGSRLVGDRTDEPTPPAGQAICPAWVLGEARKHWDVILPMLEGMGVMAPAYSAGLALLVNSLGRYIDYEHQVTETGPVTMTDKGNMIVNPMWAARNKAWDQVLKALREYGLTPASVTGVKAIEHDEKKDDDIGTLINPKLRLG